MKKPKDIKAENKIVFTNKQVDKIKEIFDNQDEIVEDDELVKLKKKRNKTDNDSIVFAQLFNTCYSYFRGNSYFLSEKKAIYDKFRDYLDEVHYIEKLRSLIEEYKDGEEYGSYIIGERIKDFVSKHREDMDDLVNLFFRTLGGEE